MTTAAETRRAQNHGALKNGSNGKVASIFDLDAYQAEAMRLPFTFTAGGQQFTMPHLLDMDWHASLDDDGNPGGADVLKMLREGLGDQWPAFNKCKVAGKPVSTDSFNQLWHRWTAHSGIDVGEGSASAP